MSQIISTAMGSKLYQPIHVLDQIAKTKKGNVANLVQTDHGLACLNQLSPVKLNILAIFSSTVIAPFASIALCLQQLLAMGFVSIYHLLRVFAYPCFFASTACQIKSRSHDSAKNFFRLTRLCKTGILSCPHGREFMVS